MATDKVVIISTGGTIAMRYDPDQQALLPAISGEELLGALPELGKICPLEVLEFSNLPSPHLTVHHLLDLAQTLEQVLADKNVLGAVITHGTDTLEETAYFLNLVLESKKPVVITGAMRSPEDLGSDGSRNLLDAVRTVVTPDAIAQGVMVVMNQEIHSAEEVTKTHTSSLHAFQSVFWGPLGYIDEDQVIFVRKAMVTKKIITNQIIESVYLVKLALGMDGFLIEALADKPVKGIVLEAMGRGNIPPQILPVLKRARAKNIPVVLTTRCFGGRVLDVYGYPGAAKDLKELGVIFAGELSSQKARLKLMLALSKTNDFNQLADFFK